MKQPQKIVTNFRKSIERVPHETIEYRFQTTFVELNGEDVVSAVNGLIKDLVEMQPPIADVESLGSSDISVKPSDSFLTLSYTRTDDTTIEVPEGWRHEGYVGVIQEIVRFPRQAQIWREDPQYQTV